MSFTFPLLETFDMQIGNIWLCESQILNFLMILNNFSQILIVVTTIEGKRG